MNVQHTFSSALLMVEFDILEAIVVSSTFESPTITILSYCYNRALPLNKESQFIYCATANRNLIIETVQETCQMVLLSRSICKMQRA
jgi:hypothetical protein